MAAPEADAAALAAHERPPPLWLAFRDLSYTPLVRSGRRAARRVVLQGVSSAAAPGQLCALMGPSGAGKTAVLSCIAGQVDPADVAGALLVNGVEVRALPKRRVGYVFQDDLLLPHLTVRETVACAAALKLPLAVGAAARDARVEALLRELGLAKCADAAMGGAARRGVSGGERKRTAVAVELVTAPSVLLLDEPTSGLDATTALRLCQTLRALADGGLTVLSTIHQPRTTIFALFDRLLLLCGGRTAYDGAAVHAVAYLEGALRCSLPAQTNAADWLLDVCAADETAAGGPRLASLFAAHVAAAAAEGGGAPAGADAAGNGGEGGSSGSLRGLDAADCADDATSAATSEAKYATGFATQLRVLLRRCSKQQRGSSLTRVAAAQSAVLSLLTGLFWLRMPADDSFIPERLSLLFFLLIAVANVAVNASISTFASERPLLARERAKGMYRMAPYLIAKTLSDMGTTVLYPILNAILVYWMAGLRPSGSAFFVFLSGFTLSLLVAQSLGLCLSVAIRDVSLSLVLAPLLTLLSLILGGFYIRLSRMPPWLHWLPHASFARYAYTGLVVNEFTGRTFPCADPGRPAYGRDCPVAGEAVIAALAMSGERVWPNYLVLLAFQAGLRLLTYALLRWDVHIL